MKRFLRDNGLTLVLMTIFLLTWIGQWLAGWRVFNSEQSEHGQPEVSVLAYLARGHFWQATGENWESEFLQMAMFVILSCWLYQRGSPESKDPEKPGQEPVDADPRERRGDPRAPWPVRRGGPLVLWLYERSLSICFSVLFILSVFVHAGGGVRAFNEEQREHGQETVSMIGYLGTSEFWFESFQNWQSEFLSLAAMVYLSVYLRQRGSGESKPVAAAHEDHGD